MPVSKVSAHMISFKGERLTGKSNIMLLYSWISILMVSDISCSHIFGVAYGRWPGDLYMGELSSFWMKYPDVLRNEMQNAIHLSFWHEDMYLESFFLSLSLDIHSFE